MELYRKPQGVQSRWASFEGQGLERGAAGTANRGAKGHASEPVSAGECKVLLDVRGSGTICRIWLTVSDRSPEMLKALRFEIFWDGEETPAVSAPLGDFFGIAHGRRLAFENALFSDPEGRSFNCFIPMPFRKGARVTLTNGSENLLPHLFYDIDLLTEVEHPADTLYFHAHHRAETPNRLGEEYAILPFVNGNGRFLGCNVGVRAAEQYEGAWWGEGEVKVRMGGETNPTLCGTGSEDYIGTAWGQGSFINRTQGCTVADAATGEFAFYRFHVDDPVYFDNGCAVSIQTIGGTELAIVRRLIEKGVPLAPTTIDPGDGGDTVLLLDDPEAFGRLEKMWCNFWRQDDWCSTAYFYLDRPDSELNRMLG